MEKIFNLAQKYIVVANGLLNCEIFSTMKKEWMNPENLNFKNDYEKAMYYKHFKAYTFVYDIINGKRVLELGCGAGYGINHLAQKAEKIVTVDIDIDSINYARKNTNAKNIEFIHQDILDGLNFENESFDIIISFQVFEHFTRKDLPIYLQEISRLLKPNGTVYLTTPNREIRLYPFQKPLNKYHPVEYSYKSLKKVLCHYFRECKILALRSDPVIEELFNKRKKMKIHYVYILKPIRGVVLSISKALKLKFLVNYLNRRSRYIIPHHDLNIGDITYENFWYEKKEYHKGIDFMAICKK